MAESLTSEMDSGSGSAAAASASETHHRATSRRGMHGSIASPGKLSPILLARLTRLGRWGRRPSVPDRERVVSPGSVSWRSPGNTTTTAATLARSFPLAHGTLRRHQAGEDRLAPRNREGRDVLMPPSPSSSLPTGARLGWRVGPRGLLLRDDDPGPARARRVAGRGRGDPRRHGEHRQLLEAGPQRVGAAVLAPRRQRRPHEGGAGTQDRPA